MDFDFEEYLEDTFPWLKDSFLYDEEQLTLYLDADYIAYTVGFCSSQEEYDMYLEGRYDVRKKYDHACYLILDAMKKAHVKSVRFFVTDSATNFRTKLVDNYKAQRAEEKPPFWQEVKDWMWSHDNTVFSQENEADDQVSIEANKHYLELDSEGVDRTEAMYKIWSKVIIGSKDKDVDQVYGWHVNLDTGEHYFVDFLGELKPKYTTKEINDYEYWRTVDGTPVPNDYTGPTDVYARGKSKGLCKTKRVCIGKVEVQRIKALKGTGAKFFYAQMLMGDPTDNYFGIPKLGPTGAYELLDSATTIEECHKIVWESYRKAYPDELEALKQWKLNGRMAYMLQRPYELWNGGGDFLDIRDL